MLVFFLFLAASASAHAAPSACDIPIDLREPGGSMAGLDPTSQGYHQANMLCGFVAFTNYLDAYRIARKGERGEDMTRVSPVAVGVENALHRNLPYWFPLQNSTDPLGVRIGRGGSTFCGLAEAVREIGYCADDSLPTRTVDQTANFADINSYVYAELLKIAETRPRRRPAAIDAKIGELYAKYFEWASERGNIRFTQAELRALIAKQPTKPYATIRALFLPNCAEASHRRTDFDFKSCRSLPAIAGRTTRGSRTASHIAELLERPHALPIPFSYCSVVLTEGKAYSDRTIPVGADCGLHWSVIAGRRRIGNDCYLLVHNSWRNFDGYSKDWIVDREDVWVREKELAHSVLLLQWLDE